MDLEKGFSQILCTWLTAAESRVEDLQKTARFYTSSDDSLKAGARKNNTDYDGNDTENSTIVSGNNKSKEDRVSVLEELKSWNSNIQEICEQRQARDQSLNALNDAFVRSKDFLIARNVDGDSHNKKTVCAEEKERQKPEARKSDDTTDSSEQAPKKENPPAQAESRGNHVQNLKIREISDSEFDGIPKYLKQRITRDQLNGFIRNFNAAIAHKHQLLKSKFQLLSKKDKDLVIVFREQACDKTKGSHFCVAEDLKSFASPREILQMKTLMPILRHLKRLVEVRQGGLLRYVVCAQTLD